MHRMIRPIKLLWQFVLVAGVLLVSYLGHEIDARGDDAELLEFFPSWESRALSALGELDSAIEYWESRVVRYCEGVPSKDDCDDGDALLFNGLLCTAGDERGCQAVRDSQGSDGRWWRSPRRIDGNLGLRNSFSRDMSLGVLLYLARTRDTVAAVNWMNWIENNRACAVTEPSSGSCRRLVPTYRFCRDDSDQRCLITPALWASIGRVWSHLGLPLTKVMEQNRHSDLVSEIVSARYAKPGYEQHLLAVTALLNRELGQREMVNRIVASQLFQGQPQNPFFQFLAGRPPAEVEKNLLTLCKKPGDSMDFVRHQWSWERRMEGQPWLESMGWDCIFMAKILQNAAP